MKGVRFLVLLLLVIGALNWGMIGFFKYDVVSHIFGGMMKTGARVIFGLVGLAGLYGVMMLLHCTGCCKCGPNCGCCGKNGNNHK